MATDKTVKRTKRAPTATRKEAAPTRKKSRAGTSNAKSGTKPRAKTKGGTKPRAKTKGGTKKSKSGGRRKRAVTPSLPNLVGIYETTSTNAKRASESARALGYMITDESGKDELCARIASPVPPDIVLVSVPGGEDVLEAVAAKTRLRPVVIASMAGPASSAVERCEQAGADLVTLRPHSRDSLCAVLRAASVLAADRQKIAAMRGTEDILRERLQRYGQADAATGFQHFDFFKHILVTEIKRAKRYGYSLAACVVALDPMDSGKELPPAIATKLRTRVASAIVACIRDIDLPVDFAEDRFLVLLPYTDIKGAERVGRRIASSVASYGAVSDAAADYASSVSVGIAALRPNKPVSFAKLMRDASAAVRASQLKGGGRVVVRA